MSRFATPPSSACSERSGGTKPEEFSNGTFGQFTPGTHKTTNVKDERQLVIGEGLRFHIRDELWDPEAMRVHMDRYHPVGRMFADRYCRTNDRMEFPPAPVVKAKAAE